MAGKRSAIARRELPIASDSDSSAGLRIFISYRREEGGGHAGRIRDDLAQHFGRGHVFRDIDALPAGADFEDVIDEAIENSDVLIAVIGTRWLTVTDDEGERRIDDPEDLLRMELEAALKAKKGVIPVLVDGAKMPAKKELPKELVGLRRRHAFRVDDDTWRRGMAELIENIERIQPTATPPGDEPPEDGEPAEAPTEPTSPVDTPPMVAGEPSRDLEELVRDTDLRYQGTSEGLGVAFKGERVKTVLVQARELGSDVAYFSVDIPDPGRIGRERALHALLRVSYMANYMKVSRQSSGNIVLAAELPKAALTAQVTEGIIRSFAQLGDVNKADLIDADGWGRRLRESQDVQRRYIALDPDQAIGDARHVLESAGMQCDVSPAGLRTSFEFGEAEMPPLTMSVRVVGSAISFVTAFGDSKPKGDKKAYMRSLLELNHLGNVAKVGLDSDDDINLLYEVPRVFPDIVERLREQFAVMLLGISAVHAGASS